MLLVEAFPSAMEMIRAIVLHELILVPAEQEPTVRDAISHSAR
jgi:hypothetical protein